MYKKNRKRRILCKKIGVSHIKPFNIRFDIDREESLISFLYRLSIANHYTSPKMIGDSLGIKWWGMPLNMFDENVCEELSLLSALDKGNLYSRSYHSILKGLEENQYKMWFLRTHTKYCPKCLVEKRIHHYLWGLRPVSLCKKHAAVLLNECKNCKRKIQINSLIYGKCNSCNFSLEQAETTYIDKSELLYISQLHFQKLLNGEHDEIFRGLSASNVINLFHAMFRLFDGFESMIELNESFRDKKICLQPANDIEYAVAFSNVYWMLFKDFPRNFIHALATFYNGDSTRKKYRNRQFTDFLTSHNKYGFVIEAFEFFKGEQIKMGLVPRNLESFDVTGASKLKNMYYTKKDLFKLFDISRAEINQMCNSQILAPMKLIKKNHTNYYFEKCKTEEIIKTYLNEKEDLVSKKEAAKILGISVEAIVHLIEKEVIIQKRGSIGGQYSFISKRSIDILLMQLCDKAVVIHEEETKNFVGFKKCLDKYVTSGLQIGKLLHWAKSNVINFYSVTKDIHIDNLYFIETELKEQLYKENELKNGYSLGDVSRVLGYTEKTIHKMIKAQLINPSRVSISSNGRRTYSFDKELIEKLKEEYITLVDAVEKYHVNYSTLNNFSHKKIIKNHLKGVCQKTLFMIDELEGELVNRGFIRGVQ